MILHRLCVFFSFFLTVVTFLLILITFPISFPLILTALYIRKKFRKPYDPSKKFDCYADQMEYRMTHGVGRWSDWDKS